MEDEVRVFVSHHHSPDEDAFTARLVADLEAAGADVWVDDQRITSDDFIKKINEGLAGRQWLVLVMTPQSVGSPWVQREVNVALHEHTAGRMLGVIPIVAEPTSESDIPMLWRPLHRYDATRSYEPARDGLLHALSLLDSRYPLPDVPARLASLGFRGINANGTPAIIPPLITIPGGPFLMGSDKSRDSETFDFELPQHRVEVAMFQIAKYPVTVEEYAFAVRADAVRQPPEHFVTWQQQQQYPDRPVVCVSWTDAMIYIAWLRAVTDQRGWRLPTEAEWEKAARWDTKLQHSFIYPWGDRFDRDRCNTAESATIRSASAIGSYSASDERHSGVSPYGIEDMAGNVWEWTSSLYKSYPYMPHDGREDLKLKGDRVRRGGSWYVYAKQARSACRAINSPEFSNNSRGFRLALSPNVES